MNGRCPFQVLYRNRTTGSGIRRPLRSAPSGHCCRSPPPPSRPLPLRARPASNKTWRVRKRIQARARTRRALDALSMVQIEPKCIAWYCPIAHGSSRMTDAEATTLLRQSLPIAEGRIRRVRSGSRDFLPNC